VTNFAAYDESLRLRGDLTVWINEEARALWAAAPRTTPGGQAVYSDLAIELWHGVQATTAANPRLDALHRRTAGG
jgi:hypothetical protein